MDSETKPRSSQAVLDTALESGVLVGGFISNSFLLQTLEIVYLEEV